MKAWGMRLAKRVGIKKAKTAVAPCIALQWGKEKA
jgi:hypothetical protein